MEEKELKALMEGIAAKNGEAIKAAVKTEVEAAVKGLLTVTDFTTRMETLGLKSDVIKTLSDALERQGLEMRKLFDGKAIKKTLEEVVLEKGDAIKSISTGGANVKMSVNKTLLTRAAISGSTMAYQAPDMGQLAYPVTIIESLFRKATVGPGSNGVIRYYDQNAITRGANWVAEGAQKPESAISWIERLLPIEKIADSIPVTKEAWADIPYIQSEIRRLLEVNISLKKDESLYKGTGVTPEIRGVYTAAPAFVTTPYADTVEGANLLDLILVVAADIAAGRGSKYAPDTVLLNPINTLGTKLMKNAQGNYIIPPFANGNNVGGLRIVESSVVTPNTMVVGDFRYGTIYQLEDFTLEMGWINDQFIKNCFTILAEERLALMIRTVDETAFRKVTNITTALGDLETP